MKKLLALILSICVISACGVWVHALGMFVPINEFYSTSKSIIQDWYRDAYWFVKNELILPESIIDIYYTEDGFNRKVYIFDFMGDSEATRSLAASVLHRYNGSSSTIFTDGYENSTCPAFVDVPDGQYYTPGAQWAYDNGIVNGVGGAYFAPDRTVTREEFATMLYRFTNYLEVDTSARADFSAFADGDSVSPWAADAISWAVAEGLISGKPDNLLAPQDTITRAEVALIVYRYNNGVKAHYDIPWEDR